jgi:hypothetical protein
MLSTNNKIHHIYQDNTSAIKNFQQLKQIKNSGKQKAIIMRLK